MECPASEAPVAASSKDVQEGKQGQIGACSKELELQSSKRQKVARSAASHKMAEQNLLTAGPEEHARGDETVCPPDDDFM